MCPRKSAPRRSWTNFALLNLDVIGVDIARRNKLPFGSRAPIDRGVDHEAPAHYWLESPEAVPARRGPLQDPGYMFAGQRLYREEGLSLRRRRRRKRLSHLRVSVRSRWPQTKPGRSILFLTACSTGAGFGHLPCSTNGVGEPRHRSL